MGTHITINVYGDSVDVEGGSLFEETVLAALEGLAQQMTDITTALADLNTKVDATNTLIAQDATDKAAAQATIADLQSQIAALQAADLTDKAAADTAVASLAAAGDAVEAAVGKLNPIAPITPIPDPTPDPNPTPDPTAGLPRYTYDGTAPVTSDWTGVPGTTPQQYTFAGDVAGQPATGDGIGGVWHLFNG